jgi:hypothetical protein
MAPKDASRGRRTSSNARLASQPTRRTREPLDRRDFLHRKPEDEDAHQPRIARIAERGIDLPSNWSLMSLKLIPSPVEMKTIWSRRRGNFAVGSPAERSAGRSRHRGKGSVDQPRKSPHEAGKGSPEKGGGRKQGATEVKSNVLILPAVHRVGPGIEGAPFNSIQWKRRDAAKSPPP